MENGGSYEGAGSGKGRLPTVNEAIPYSPFSSIVPFNSSESWHVKDSSDDGI